MSEERQSTCKPDAAPGAAAAAGVSPDAAVSSHQHAAPPSAASSAAPAGSTPPSAEPSAGPHSHVLDRMMSGSIAGAISRSAAAPIDRVRILYQVDPAREFTIRAAMKTARKIYASTGIPGLWRGNGAALVRVVPYSGLLFCTFPTYEDLASRYDPDNAVANRFVAGALAGATATTLTYPLDLLRARMAAHWGPEPLYEDYLTGLSTIHRSEGFNALFHGLRPTLMGIVPYSGIGFMSFETMKSKLLEVEGLKHDRDLPTAHRLAAGAVSGLMAQSLTYPLHVIRRRMQVRPEEYAGMTMSGACKKIYLQEGVGGLFKGLTLTFAKGPLTVALGFTLNDLIKSRIEQIRMAAVRSDLPPPARTPATGLDDLQTPEKPPPKDERNLSALESLLCGAVAGCTAKTVIAPADRIKIIFQVNQEKYSFAAAVKKGHHVTKLHGFKGLWRGHGVTLIRVIPYSGTSYMTYDRYLQMLKNTFAPDSEKPNALILFLAGSMAGVTATTLTYPLDLLRTRLATHGHMEGHHTHLEAGHHFGRHRGHHHYQRPMHETTVSYYGVVRTIVRDEGWPKLFAGLRPTVSGIVPYAGLSFMTFETLKASIRQRHGLERDRDIPTPLRLMSGGFAGLVAQSATYPLDIVRRRMQVGRLHAHLSLRQAIKEILVKEGWHALYRGLTMNWFKGPISISISFTTNDAMKTFMRDADFPAKIDAWWDERRSSSSAA